MRPIFAPIALFVYRRTDLLDRVLDSLEACPEFAQSPVHVFSDGAKNSDGAADVAAVRALVRVRLRPNMMLTEAPENRGLARSIVSGVTQLCVEHGRVIVIEDDLIVSPGILTWFNNALDRFADQPQVFQVSAHVFESPKLARRDAGFFLPMTTSWGWATWQRAWESYDPEASGWEKLKSDRALRRRFDLNGAYPYSDMLEQQMAGKIDSWAIRWAWSVFRRDGLTLFPPQPLLSNEGTDADATHRGPLGRLRRLIARPTERKVRKEAPAMPDHVAPDGAACAAVRESIVRSTSKLSPSYWLRR